MAGAVLMIRRAAVVLSAILALTCGCYIQGHPVSDRPAPSPDSGDLPPADITPAPGDPEAPGLPHGRAGQDVPGPEAPAAVPTEWRELTGAGGERYEVGPADTLSQIAMDRLDTMHNLPLLMLANRKLTRPEMVWKGEIILIPGPGFFAAPFIRSGERAAGQQLLRYAESSREGFVGVSLAGTGSGAGRFVAVQVRAGRARVVFDSTGLLPRAPAGAPEAPWTWRAADLDSDGGLDLVGWRNAGPGEAFQACVFQSTERAYRRHTLGEAVRRGEFEGRKAVCRDGTLTIRGEVPAGRGRFEPATLRCRWVGDRFDVTGE